MSTERELGGRTKSNSETSSETVASSDEASDRTENNGKLNWTGNILKLIGRIDKISKSDSTNKDIVTSRGISHMTVKQIQESLRLDSEQYKKPRASLANAMKGSDLLGKMEFSKSGNRSDQEKIRKIIVKIQKKTDFLPDLTPIAKIFDLLWALAMHANNAEKSRVSKGKTRVQQKSQVKATSKGPDRTRTPAGDTGFLDTPEHSRSTHDATPYHLESPEGQNPENTSSDSELSYSVIILVRVENNPSVYYTIRPSKLDKEPEDRYFYC